MDELLKKIMLLSKEEKKVIFNMLSEEVFNYGEGHRVTKDSIETNHFNNLNKRKEDILYGAECLITFEDHLYNINL